MYGEIFTQLLNITFHEKRFSDSGVDTERKKEKEKG
jgi:hypothetical protein